MSTSSTLHPAACLSVCSALQKALEKGFSFIILSDRAFGPSRVPIPSLLATGAVHHHLVGLKMRTRAGLLVETAEVGCRVLRFTRISESSFPPPRGIIPSAGTGCLLMETADVRFGFCVLTQGFC